jgi:hypothetical protein
MAEGNFKRQAQPPATLKLSIAWHVENTSRLHPNPTFHQNPHRKPYFGKKVAVKFTHFFILHITQIFPISSLFHSANR